MANLVEKDSEGLVEKDSESLLKRIPKVLLKRIPKVCLKRMPTVLQVKERLEVEEHPVSGSRVPQLTCIWMSVGGRNPFTQSNLTLAAS